MPLDKRLSFEHDSLRRSATSLFDGQPLSRNSTGGQEIRRSGDQEQGWLGLPLFEVSGYVQAWATTLNPGQLRK